MDDFRNKALLMKGVDLSGASTYVSHDILLPHPVESVGLEAKSENLSAGTADFILQGSIDGDNWEDIISISAVATNGTTVEVSSGVVGPYKGLRCSISASATNMEASATAFWR